MDNLSFTSEVIRSLAWPSATLAIVLVLRKPMGEVLRVLRRVKYGELEAEFGEQLKAIAEKIPVAPQSDETADRKQRLIQLAEEFPNSAMIEAWNDVEDATRMMANDRKVKIVTPSTGQLIADLFKIGALSQEEKESIERLKTLRNLAAHGVPVDSSMATSYVEAASNLAARLRSK